jgi:hypothetical protein
MLPRQWGDEREQHLAKKEHDFLSVLVVFLSVTILAEYLNPIHRKC